MPRPNTTNTAMRFITRARDPLWRVWVQFRNIDLGQVYFSDKQHGGKDAALKAAMVCRDKMVREHNIPLRTYAGSGFCVSHKKSKSGSVGISLEPDNPSNPGRVNWVAKNEVDGSTKKCARSIRKYGYVGAWKIVAQFRQEHTGQPVPENPPPPPEWLRDWATERGVVLPILG